MGNITSTTAGSPDRLQIDFYGHRAHYNADEEIKINGRTLTGVVHVEGKPPMTLNAWGQDCGITTKAVTNRVKVVGENGQTTSKSLKIVLEERRAAARPADDRGGLDHLFAENIIPIECNKLGGGVVRAEYNMTEAVKATGGWEGHSVMGMGGQVICDGTTMTPEAFITSICNWKSISGTYGRIRVVVGNGSSGPTLRDFLKQRAEQQQPRKLDAGVRDLFHKPEITIEYNNVQATYNMTFVYHLGIFRRVTKASKATGVGGQVICDDGTTMTPSAFMTKCGTGDRSNVYDRIRVVVGDGRPDPTLREFLQWRKDAPAPELANPQAAPLTGDDCTLEAVLATHWGVRAGQCWALDEDKDAHNRLLSVVPEFCTAERREWLVKLIQEHPFHDDLVNTLRTEGYSVHYCVASEGTVEHEWLKSMARALDLDAAGVPAKRKRNVIDTRLRDAGGAIAMCLAQQRFDGPESQIATLEGAMQQHHEEQHPTDVWPLKVWRDAKSRGGAASNRSAGKMQYLFFAAVKVGELGPDVRLGKLPTYDFRARAAAWEREGKGGLGIEACIREHLEDMLHRNLSDGM